ncbi:hypothetical protein SAMN05428975_1047 [Mucilaginibacter sp. OK268]|nr:hypothetical protein SAMN05428975_1047 [Mucilaginibacter sp. OK268]
MQIKLGIISILLMINTLNIQAQNAITPTTVPAMASFLEGSWQGEGEFTNGRKIAAKATFHLSLDSCWLSYTHEDRLPNTYKALSMWSIDRSKPSFSATIFDNFRGNRTFVGINTNPDLIILSRKDETKPQQTFERFRYMLIDKNHFQMSYERSLDGQSWKTIDTLLFKRE